MSEFDTSADAVEMTPVRQHKFLLLVGGTIIISLILVGISLVIYAKSGAEQLDLSRPGYQKLSQEVSASRQQFDSFPPDGPLDQGIARQFLDLYTKESDNVTKADAFGGDPLSKKSLSINGN